MKKIYILGFIVVILIVVWTLYPRSDYKKTKIGYFHGGRTMLIYRSYIDNELGNTILVTKDLNNPRFYEVSKRYNDIVDNYNFGKVRGGELIDEVVNGNIDGATVGESSFIKAVTEGKPIVAVAMLGHDTKKAPAHAILFRKGLTLKNPKDIKGKTLVTRRAGDGDETFLREYIAQIGLDPNTDVKIVSQVDDDKWMSGLKNGDFDGGYYHEMAVESLVIDKEAYIYRRLDWVNPEMSQALLVFNKDFVESNPDEIKKIVEVYMKRIEYEQKLSKDVRLGNGENTQKGLRMEADFNGMNLPQYSYPPLVSNSLLTEMCKLLIKHDFISGECKFDGSVDNSFVQNILKGDN